MQPEGCGKRPVVVAKGTPPVERTRDAHPDGVRDEQVIQEFPDPASCALPPVVFALLQPPATICQALRAVYRGVVAGSGFSTSASSF